MSDVEAKPLFDTSGKKKKSKKVYPEDGVEEVTSMVSEFGLKKKSSKKASPPAEGEPAEGGDFEFKKKKKKSKPVATADEFDIALQNAGIEEEAALEEAEAENQLGYTQLLSRFFDILREQNPEMAGDRTGIKYKIPPPEVLRDGNKKTLFANIKLIADKMHRPTEHVIHYLFTELGTSGSVDGTGRLVIKGRFQQKQIEGVLRRYMLEYVACKTCKSVNTTLNKENRLYFLDCNSCGSRRSVQGIKAGYQVVTRRSRMRK